MKKQVTPNFRTSTQSLALVFGMLFVMAFACNDGGDNPPLSDKRGDNPQGGEFTYQTDVGKPYGTRDPRTCTNTKAPTTGAITVPLAAKYFICQVEGEWSNNLYLVEDVKVEVGGTISYSAIRGQYSFNQIDVNRPIYQIRGSYTKYQCRRVYEENAQPSCNVEKVKGDGYCYKTTFGDWQCNY